MEHFEVKNGLKSDKDKWAKGESEKCGNEVGLKGVCRVATALAGRGD